MRCDRYWVADRFVVTGRRIGRAGRCSDVLPRGAAGLDESKRLALEARLADAGFEAVHVRSPAPILWPPLRHMVARDSTGRIAISKQVLGT